MAGLEGLRGLAAYSVVSAHILFLMGDAVTGGQGYGLRHGLTLFFALSGFLLYRPFALSILNQTKPPSTLRFYINRIIRIYPAYISILLLTSYGLKAANITTGTAETHGTLEPLPLLANLSLFQTLAPETFHTGLSASWSITVELTFYLLLPFLVAAAQAASRNTPKSLTASLPAAFLLTVGLSSKYWIIKSTTNLNSEQIQEFFWSADWTGVFTHSIAAHADLFAFGMVAATISAWLETSKRQQKQISAARLASYVIILAAGGFGFNGAVGSFGDTAIAAACAALILLIALPKDRVTQLLVRVLDLRVPKYLGKISYSVYLWHIPVIVWFTQRRFGQDVNWSQLYVDAIIVFTATTALSVLTYHLVEYPALRLKRRTDGRPNKHADDKTNTETESTAAAKLSNGQQ
ncbi:acyltransferase [Rhodococcus fascians]|nr:acyltransferase [Rhodococcus fascians]MDJ0002927.1 acyltransferase [Rhodococcus fascians]